MKIVLTMFLVLRCTDQKIGSFMNFEPRNRPSSHEAGCYKSFFFDRIIIFRCTDQELCMAAELHDNVRLRDSATNVNYRVQVAFLMQLVAYTLSRLGSITESDCYKGLGQVLKYKIRQFSFSRLICTYIR